MTSIGSESHFILILTKTQQSYCHVYTIVSIKLGISQEFFSMKEMAPYKIMRITS